MKITVVNGQSHKGSTYHIGKMLADKLGGKVTEFFLPKDFSDMCIGCTSCFIKNEHLCPHHARLEKLTETAEDGLFDVLQSEDFYELHHDLGFQFQPTAVMRFKQTGSLVAKRRALGGVLGR